MLSAEFLLPGFSTPCNVAAANLMFSNKESDLISTQHNKFIHIQKQGNVCQ